LSRTLNDDFDEDDLPAGNLDLEKGSAQVGAGVASNYGGDGIDFDDELYGSGDGPGASLELDLPKGGPASADRGHGASAPTKGALPHAPPAPPPRVAAGGAPGAAGLPGVPDLAFDAKPPPRSSGSLPAARTSGQQPAVRPSGQQHAAPPPAPPPPAPAPSSPASDGHHGFAPPPASSSNVTMAPLSTPPPSSSGRLPAAHANAPDEPPPPPAKPTSAALIAKYPEPPRAVANAPVYAIKVFMRQLELRTDLESLRRRRSPDVPLYEAALKAYDPKTFRLGMAINIAALTLATFIFFLPVILRFMRD
jgi:hypothetical protein